MKVALLDAEEHLIELIDDCAARAMIKRRVARFHGRVEGIAEIVMLAGPIAEQDGRGADTGVEHRYSLWDYTAAHRYYGRRKLSSGALCYELADAAIDEYESNAHVRPFRIPPFDPTLPGYFDSATIDARKMHPLRSDVRIGSAGCCFPAHTLHCIEPFNDRDKAFLGECGICV